MRAEAAAKKGDTMPDGNEDTTSSAVNRRNDAANTNTSDNNLISKHYGIGLSTGCR